MKFEHFIITRFNLRSNQLGWSADKSGETILTQDWLKNRIELFKSYCLPSVLHQSNKKFHWLIYFDSETPQESISFLKELKQQEPQIHVIYKESYEQFMEEYCADILKIRQESTTHIISTRLDNDDAIHENFIKTIQSQFDNQNYLAVNFIKVLLSNPGLSNIYLDYQFSNHFISLIESVEKGIKGCFHKPDKRWNVKGEIKHLDGGPFVFELIHEKNMINHFIGFPTYKKWDLKGFQQGTGRTIFKLSHLKIWRMSWRKWLIYRFRLVTLN